MTVETRYAHSPSAVRQMDTAALREAFVDDGLFAEGECRGVYLHHDRILAFGIVPLAEPLGFPHVDQVRAAHVLQRREAGVLNIGGPGAVTVDGQTLELANKEAAYLGRGGADVAFSSEDPDHPAVFYVFTAVAHTSLPHVKIGREQMNIVEIGAPERSNHRTLHQCIIEGRTASANIAFGFTTVHSGSTWNTMPPHTHDRRTECYLYFDLDEDDRVFHFLGLPEETRHVVLEDRALVASPSWSVHFGAGTGPYSFVWATAGENAAYDDMDHVTLSQIR
ncbi:5-dehydro-4-deoxy-D-glucuronate isomerase [Microbacterium hydrocarbonoxydans]|uniref:5-dehydro-4-deoxy-D-glucuronate isomerase n=1 Tax=Microbacterium hydrocarbonoxydans TaxID=273678 RepID=UPI001FBBB52F|nr:5-dehydro-4-deoxy-D-glucuronate isomerase [Microbacterium hydrocarbonoxydans]